jgi:hypothetical protein
LSFNTDQPFIGSGLMAVFMMNRRVLFYAIIAACAVYGYGWVWPKYGGNALELTLLSATMDPEQVYERFLGFQPDVMPDEHLEARDFAGTVLDTARDRVSSAEARGFEISSSSALRSLVRWHLLHTHREAEASPFKKRLLQTCRRYSDDRQVVASIHQAVNAQGTSPYLARTRR